MSKYKTRTKNSLSKTPKSLHVIIAENALGKILPKGAEVHHIDGYYWNNDRTNLVICENVKYHRLLHVRKRILDMGGDPNIHKTCSKCKQMKFKTEFYSNRRNYDNRTDACKKCIEAIYYLKKYGNQKLNQ